MTRARARLRWSPRCPWCYPLRRLTHKASSHFTLRDGEQWQANYAFESKKECKSAAAAAVLREAARRGNTVAGDHVTTASGDLRRSASPDTVDPRGAKAQ